MKTFLLNAGLNVEDCFTDIQNVTNGFVALGVHGYKINSGLADSDLFICDINNLQHHSDFSRRLNENKHHILNRIKGGAVLVCFGGHLVSYPEFTTYTWLEYMSGGLSPENLSANDLTFIKEKPFTNFFKGENFTYDVIFNRNSDGLLEPFVQNKGKKTVGFYGQLDDGHIFIFPQPKDKNAFVKYFIKTILPVLNINFEIPGFIKEPIPEDINAISVANQDEIIQQIEEQKIAIETENNKLEELNKKYNELNEWKDLLYQTDIHLESIVKKFFLFLGLPLEKKLIDLVGIYNGKEVFIEVKGKKGGIDHKGDFRQIEERKNYDAVDPENTIALLIGNPFRLESLDKRPPDVHQHNFAPTSIPIAQRESIGLIETTELFKIINDILLNSDIDKNEILDNLMSCVGVFSYKKYGTN